MINMNKKTIRYYRPPREKGYIISLVLAELVWVYMLYLFIIGKVSIWGALFSLMFLIIFGLILKFLFKIQKLNKKESYIELYDTYFIFPFDPEQQINKITIYYSDLTLVEERRILGRLKKNSYIYIETNNNRKLEIAYEKLDSTDYDSLLQILERHKDKSSS